MYKKYVPDDKRKFSILILYLMSQIIFFGILQMYLPNASEIKHSSTGLSVIISTSFDVKA
jgi:hypothetical protein